MDRRFIAPQSAGLRVSKREDGQQILTAYAAVFYRAGDPGTEYQIWDDMVERIMPTAFDAALSEGDDARAFWDHRTDQLLGRRGSETLRLKTDDRGLQYEIDLPDTGAGRDLAVLVERGDVPGSSFGFLAGYGAKRGRVVWMQETRDGKTVDVREVHELTLYEVSPCSFPAYTGTGSPSLRAVHQESIEQRLRAERDAWYAAHTIEDAAGEYLDLTARLADARSRGWL